MNRVTIQTSDDVIDLLVVPVYTELAGACVLYYDYLLTLRSEVQFVWKKRTGLSTAFYFIIRYGSILVSALTLVHIVPPPFPGPGLHLTESSCRGLISLSVVLNACIFAAISAYRAVPGPPSLVACVSYLSKSSISLYPVMIEYFPLISSAVSIVYELTCLVLTAFKTFSLWQDQRRTGMSTRFTSMLLRDGKHYYISVSDILCPGSEHAALRFSLFCVSDKM
ncbi:hypothetical protein C8Q78DRAFT_764833 [Trametes maxima]|nr:hypothetical protein C8Q78DRAFT_764833 [Trametes maxima]